MKTLSKEAKHEKYKNIISIFFISFYFFCLRNYFMTGANDEIVIRENELGF